MIDIIAKIQKLLALTGEGSNATEAEMQSAMTMAQRLMAKHNIHLSQLTEKEFAQEDVDRQAVSRAHGFHKWEKILSSVVAQATDTKTYYEGRALHHMRLNFIGLKADTVCAIELFKYLQFHVNRLGKMFGKVKNITHKENAWAAYRSFCYGCVERLAERVEEEKARQAEEEQALRAQSGAASACVDLVVRKDLKIKDFLEGEGVKLRSAKPRSVMVNRDSHQAGRSAAEDLDISGKIRRLN